MAIRKYSKAFFFSTALLLAGLHLGNWVGNDAGFRVREVKVAGCKALSENEVIAAAKVPLYKSIFDVEFAPILKRVEALPHVQRAQVSRIFPSTIVITVQERKTLALINNAGLWPVDAEGIILPKMSRLSLISSSMKDRDTQSDRRVYDPAMLDIPVLSGVLFAKAGKDQQLTATGRRLIEFLAALRSSNAMLYHSISELNLNAQGNLTLYLMEGGVPVFLGRGNWMEKCDRLFIFLRHVQMPEKLAAIDLRYENQIVTKES
jgi:cell division protein FtsQ